MITTKEDLLKKLGIENLDEASQEQLLTNIATTVNNRILVKISERLSDEDLEELDKLIDKDDETAVEWYIKSKFEHYDNFALQIENEVIDEIANNKKIVLDAYKGDGDLSGLKLSL